MAEETSMQASEVIHEEEAEVEVEIPNDLIRTSIAHKADCI
jgi:hypothetical protein